MNETTGHNRSWCVYLEAVSRVAGHVWFYWAFAESRSPFWGSAFVHTFHSTLKENESLFQLFKSNICMCCKSTGWKSNFFSATDDNMWLWCVTRWLCGSVACTSRRAYCSCELETGEQLVLHLSALMKSVKNTCAQKKKKRESVDRVSDILRKWHGANVSCKSQWICCSTQHITVRWQIHLRHLWTDSWFQRVICVGLYAKLS